MALSLTGILSSLATPLAQAGISVFAVSTYDTDYLMVKEKDVESAILVLSQEAHQVRTLDLEERGRDHERFD